MSAVETLTIRHERPADRASVHDVNLRVFEDDTEAELVDALRGAAEPLISLVAVADGRIVGHVLFTPVEVERSPPEAAAMALGPMAVVPELQGRGIGSRLVRAGLRECRDHGADAVFVLGHADYYPRFGFVPAERFGLSFGSEELAPYFMALELRPGVLSAMEGRVRYRPEFG